MRNICVVTGSRADYGLLFHLMKRINDSEDFNLQTIVSGMHLSPEFGLTANEIIQDGFSISKKVEIIISADTETSISKSIGLGVISFTDAFNDIKPDLVILLGDRYEILSACIASYILKIPIAHIHGGETTVGAIDEGIRHSITKMSSFHYTSTDIYKKRVIRMGENPNTVFNFGGLGVDAIKNTKLLDKKTLEKKIEFKFHEKNIIVTFHPVTLEKNTSLNQIEQILLALTEMSDLGIIFTLSNSDTYGRIINEKIIAFQKKHPFRTKVFTSMGNVNFLSTLSIVDAIVGNSSSGLLEAPSLKTGTINIGDRQKGRLIADSVINCKPEKNSIIKALRKLYSSNHKNKIKRTISPYGNGNASKKIIKHLKSITFPINIKKEFYDL